MHELIEKSFKNFTANNGASTNDLQFLSDLKLPEDYLSFMLEMNGGEGFGFDIRKGSNKIVEIPFIGMSLEYALCVADNFTDFIKRLGEEDGLLI